MLIGPHASPAERDAYAKQIRANPADFISQPVPQLVAGAPAFTGVAAATMSYRTPPRRLAPPKCSVSRARPLQTRMPDSLCRSLEMLSCSPNEQDSCDPPIAAWADARRLAGSGTSQVNAHSARFSGNLLCDETALTSGTRSSTSRATPTPRRILRRAALPAATVGSDF